MPTVSVITPFFNPTHEQVIRSRKSIMNQTNKDFEWIQVDDGSNNDMSYEYDIRLERNYGPSVARNVGFQISSGDIITYLDMGDELNPQRVENIINLFSKYRINIVFSAYYIHQLGIPKLFNHFNWIGTPRFPTAVEYVKLLQHQNIATPLGVAHTRIPFVQIGGFQRGIVCGEDGILWRRFTNSVKPDTILFSDDIAGTYYVLDDNSSQSRTQRRFEMGGFAFDGSRNDNGKYLDDNWFKTYSSGGLYD